MFTWEDEKFNDLSVSQVCCSMQRGPLLIVLGRHYKTKTINEAQVSLFIPVAQAHILNCDNMRCVPKQNWQPLHCCRPQEVPSVKNIYHLFTCILQFTSSLHHTLLLYPTSLLFQCNWEQSVKWGYKQISSDCNGPGLELLTAGRVGVITTAL